MIDIQMSQYSIQTTYTVLVHKTVQYDTNNLWCGHICCTVNTLIDVKFPEGSFESQQFAAADGRTRSLRFVRSVTFPVQNYRDIFVFFPSRDLKHKFVIFIPQLTKIKSVIWLTSTIWPPESDYVAFCWQFFLYCINLLQIFES